tara:strand:- start:3345 stop:4055 length:711 start_codon:yes stop_codon:yes gene_type:complete
MPYPLNPTTGDEYILGSKTWKYNGSRWVKLGLSQTVSADVAFSDLTSTPTTLAGYGIPDVAFSDLASTPTTLAGYGITDAASSSSSSVPAGTVIYHAANTAPTNFIKANGAAISRTTYADLFAAIGTTFGTGDGSSTFNVPDLRGEFPRGWDDGRGIDTSRAFGSAQDDELERHAHRQMRHGVFGSGTNYPSINQYFGYAYNNYWASSEANGGSTGYTGGTETRPRNIALLACIKY